MTTPADPNRPGAPTVREIAALTARLRDISARGRDVDEAQRAAFLADKDALIARITDTDGVEPSGATVDDSSTPAQARTGEPGPRLPPPSTSTAGPVITFEGAGYYSDADLAAIGDALDAGNTERARQLQDRPWTDHTDQTDRGDGPVTPDGMREQAQRAQVELAERTAQAPERHERWDGDRWFADGYNDAHTAYLAALGHAGDPGGVDGWPVMPEEMREHAVRTMNELAAHDDRGRRDDPVGIAERVGQLRAEHGPAAAEVTITRAEAAARLTELGHDAASAQAMIAGYLHDTSRAVGVPVYQWGLDQTDVDAVAADYRWVDHERGETLVQARERAAEYATGWAARAGTVDRERSPGYGAHADTQAAQWAARATVPEPFTHPDPHDDPHPDPHDDAHDDAYDEAEVDDETAADESLVGGGGPWTAAEHDADAEHDRTAFLPPEGSRAWTEQTQQRHRGFEAAPDRSNGGGRVVVPEQDRREELARWHTDDQATAGNAVDVEQVDGVPVDLGRG